VATPQSIGSAIEAVRDFNRQGIPCSLSYLPVTVNSRLRVFQEVRRYSAVLRQIAKHHLNCDVTIKLHNFGIHGNARLARDSVFRIVELAARLRNFVWIDMELPNTVDDTIAIFTEAHRRYGNVGLCLQAYLERTDDDVARVLTHGVDS
jgi:proline dehydrogenase